MTASPIELIDAGEEEIAFYHRIGVAITTWASVEFALAQLLQVCFGNGRHASAVAEGFLSIENFRSKLLYVDTIVSGHKHISPTERINWATLNERCNTISHMRNKLAHHKVLYVVREQPGRRYKLLPRRHKRLAKRLSKPARQKQYPDEICVRDIASFESEFVALRCAINNFADRLAQRVERIPKSQELAQKPPSLARIRREIYELASRPPRPSRALAERDGGHS